MARHPSHLLTCSTLFLAMQCLPGCGKTVPPPAEPPIARRSADEIIAAARLSPEAAPRAAFEIHRIDAYAACSAAQVRLEGRARFRAETKGGGGSAILGGVVIGGLGLVGGVITTALAAGIQAPPFPSTPPPPNAELPDVEGKTGVIVAGVLTGVAVVGAAVIVVLLAAGGDDDDDDDKKQPASLPILPSGGGQLGGAVGGTVGSLLRPVGSVVGQAGSAVGQTGVGVSVQAGGALPPVQAGVGLNVQPVTTREEIAARIGAFQLECPDDPAEGALAACIDKARILRLSCSAGR